MFFKYSVKSVWLFICIFSSYFPLQSAASPEAQIFPDLQYGPYPRNTMDVYLPSYRNNNTKIILLIHGGAWAFGSKKMMTDFVDFFQRKFPQHAIANMNYRLGSLESPGMPNQVNDIEFAVKFLQSSSSKFNITGELALVGKSAGAHLAMLYSYGFDTEHNVKLIVNLYGPSDFRDPAYKNNTNFNAGCIKPLVGNYTYEENPEIYEAVSPAKYIDSSAPKTISFYGEEDDKVPKTQGPLLEDKLDSVGVYNKLYMYPGVGHGRFPPDIRGHMETKVYYFFKYFF